MELQSIERTSVAVLFGELFREQMTGNLTIIRGSARRVVYWTKGELVLVASDVPEESLSAYLASNHPRYLAVARGVAEADPLDVAFLFRQIAHGPDADALLRDWIKTVSLPLFDADEGTVFFTEAPPLELKRQATHGMTAALIAHGIRSITNGLVLRRSLGDMKRAVRLADDVRNRLDALPLDPVERQFALLLTHPEEIDAFLKRFSKEHAATAAKTVATMLALGVFEIETLQAVTDARDAEVAETQRQLNLLASIGNDPRSLRAASFASQLPSLDHYQVLDVPRAATRAQIMLRAEEQKVAYDPALFPSMVRDEILAISRRIDEAVSALAHPGRRAEYDQMIAAPGKKGEHLSLQQRLARHSIADENISKAEELVLVSDYYGAILLLKAALDFEPQNATGWFLLGSCQEKNPKWRKAAVESYQRAIAIDPNHVDALVSLGDLLHGEGLSSRALNCYQDALRIDPDNTRAKKRIKNAVR